MPSEAPDHVSNPVTPGKIEKRSDRCQTLSTLLNGKSDLSGDMALRIEKAFGPKMETLMRMQSSYDIARTRKRESKIHVRRHAAAATA